MPPVALWSKALLWRRLVVVLLARSASRQALQQTAPVVASALPAGLEAVSVLALARATVVQVEAWSSLPEALVVVVVVAGTVGDLPRKEALSSFPAVLLALLAVLAVLALLVLAVSLSAVPTPEAAALPATCAWRPGQRPRRTCARAAWHYAAAIRSQGQLALSTSGQDPPTAAEVALLGQ